MIEVKNLYKSFGKVEILKNINLQLIPGKTNLIIGKSGSGKSVLTKCIVGIHNPTEGQVLYDGEDFHKADRNNQIEIRKTIGMLFQGSALFDSKTVIENVMFPLEMFTKLSKAEIKERAEFCLNRVNIEGKNNLYPAELSGGMQKRVGIARAIATNPSYLFCDEPNSGLDPQTSIVIDNLISEITEEYKMTTIVITHDMNSVLEIGDNIYFLHQGENWWQGDKHEILKAENKELVDFVYASRFLKDIRSKLI